MSSTMHSSELAETTETESLVVSAPARMVMQVTWSLVAGGSETYALKIAANLDPERFRSMICAVDQGGALEDEVRRLGLPYRVMNRRPGIDLKLMWRLYRLFREQRVAVVNTHHFNQLFYSLPGALLAGVRIIHTEHSVELFKRRKFRMALRLMSAFCHRVVAIGEDGARVLREDVGIPESKLRVVRAGVDVRSYQVPRSDARQFLGLADDVPIVAIVARLSPEKNHRLLLDAFARVVKRNPKARLLVAGDGVSRDAVGARVRELALENSVLLLGVRRDVARLLAASDVFVLCSDREGLPIAVLEAMAAGRPVVATAVGDLPLVVQEGKTGRLVPAGDVTALANALIELLEAPGQREAMGEAARKMVEAEYGLGPMIRQHASMYAD